MSWNGQQFNRPLVMMHKESLETLCQARGFKASGAASAYFPHRSISAELALVILLTHNMVEDAVNLLASAIVPRVGVWWAYRCMELVLRDVEADRAGDGLTPAERRSRDAAAAVAALRDTGDIDALVEEQRELGRKMTAELEEKARQRQYMTPAQRMLLKLEWMQQAVAQSGLDLAEAPQEPAGILAQALESRMADTEEHVKQYVQSVLSPQEPAADLPSSDRIFEAIRAKTAGIKPAVEKEMGKVFPLKMPGLPEPPGPEKRLAALDAVMRWLLVPSDENGQLACQAAVAAGQGPESMLAYTAFWSATNLKTETGVAPANPALPALGISKTLYQLAMMEGGNMDYAARYREFLRIGIECADGTSTWGAPSSPPPVPMPV